MRRRTRWGALGALALGLGLTTIGLLPGTALSFTQGVKHGQSVIPMGHEWITRLAAIELIGGERALPSDPKDPRSSWPATARTSDTALTGAEAELKRIKGLVIPKDDDDRFAAIYEPVRDAILGERWVDIGGVNMAEAMSVDSHNCLDAVTQEAPDIQYDHFMRMPSDVDGEGGVVSATESSKRFIAYFVAAAMAADGKMTIWDGGAWSEKYQVDRRYFKFGRALHLFEDSFSPDHTVRDEVDHYRKVRQVKSYLCASGSEQHAHLKPYEAAFFDSGDVIWHSMAGRTGADDWSAYVPSNMRAYALAATEGTKEAWAAFIRSIVQPRATREAFARAQAEKVAKNWLSFDPTEMRGWYAVEQHRKQTYVQASPEHRAEDGGKGTTIAQCMARDWKGSSQAKKLADFAESRRVCLYNILPVSDKPDIDTSLRIAYDWRWRNNVKLESPPKGWTVEQPRQQTVQVKLANRANQQYLRREKESLFNDKVAKPEVVTFDVSFTPGIPLAQNAILFALSGEPGWYLNVSYNGGWRRADLYKSADNATFSVDRLADGYYSIKSIYHDVYMYMHSNDKTYVNRDGDPKNLNAQWRVEGMPEPYLVSGSYKLAFMDGRYIYVQDNKFMVGSAGRVSPEQGLVHTYLERQPDGLYKINISSTSNPAGSYLRVSSPDNTLVVADSKGATPFLLTEEQRLGQFTIRGPSGRFVWADTASSGTPLSMIDAEACFYDPCSPENWPIGGPPPGCRRGGSAACKRPAAFSLARDWQRDDR